MLRRTPTRMLQAFMITVFVVEGFVSLFCLYFKSTPFLNCPPHSVCSTRHAEEYVTQKYRSPPPEKPIMLLWFWPENYQFDMGDCKTLFDIDGCFLTDQRSLYNKSDAVLIFHKAIRWDLSNLPPSPRPVFQKWIWLNLESPTNTPRKPGIENLFNLTLNYRQDADIPVRSRLTVKKSPTVNFVLPKKDKLVCWIVSNNDTSTGTQIRENYYRKLSKHIKVHVFGKAFGGGFLKYEDYYPIIASCKFYLAFENSVHGDYITEKVNGPLAAGTVPVVLGPSRQNYEHFIPRDSFIHVNDFRNAKALAIFLLQLDKDEDTYRRYFLWRRYYSVRPHLIQRNQEFIQAICLGCEYVGRHKEYRVARDIYKWYFS